MVIRRSRPVNLQSGHLCGLHVSRVTFLLKRTLRVYPVNHAREGNHLANVLGAANPRDSTLQPQTEAGMRSEEHTSELQSHSDLVCRLLLEKKKKKKTQNEKKQKKENKKVSDKSQEKRSRPTVDPARALSTLHDTNASTMSTHACRIQT